jgi:heme/copper-type cytochrome/quinol oxidase subunit 2
MAMVMVVLCCVEALRCRHHCSSNALQDSKQQRNRTINWMAMVVMVFCCVEALRCRHCCSSNTLQDSRQQRSRKKLKRW